MRNLAILTTQCFIALYLVIQILSTTKAAPSVVVVTSIGDNRLARQLGSFRQAIEADGDSYEDSAEDDGEDDAELAQQSLIQQQNQQNLEESQEASDEDDAGEDGTDDVRHRRRRDADEAPKEEETPVEKEPSTTTIETAETAAPAAVANVAAPPSPPAPSAPVVTEETHPNSSLNRTSVLILIRDALKKVTAVLPTETVTTNALQYFQLFEHFIQKTIEQVIEDYDEDEEEATTANNLTNSTEVKPEKQETAAENVSNTSSQEKEKEKEPVVVALTEVDQNKMEQQPLPADDAEQQTNASSNAMVETVKETENQVAVDEKTTATT